MPTLEKPLKVFLMSLEYSPEASGGVGTHVEELSTGLALAGDSVTVVAGTVGKQRCLVEGNKTVHFVPPSENQLPNRSITEGILDYNHTLASYALNIAISRSGQPDLIHCQNWISYPAAAEVSRITGAPLICTVQYISRTVEEWWGQSPDPEIVAQEEEFFRKGKLFIAVSRSIRSLMRDVYSVPEDRVHVVYNGVDPGFFSGNSPSSADRERLRRVVSPDNEKIVLYAGRFHPMKGIWALLKSAALVLKEAPGTRYLMVGEPDSRAFALEFRKLLNENPVLEQKITALGKLSRRRLAVLYSVADVALAPSVYEPCGHAGIEAMASGVPLVVSDGGGYAELVQVGIHGLVVPVRACGGGLRSVDPDELAEATLRLLRDQDLARNLGSAARRRAIEMCSTEVMVRATREVYQHALSPAHLTVA